jgi:ornithine carbamoyltransferase
VLAQPQSPQHLRIIVFRDYQINAALLSAAPGECVVTHCLPAHPGQEITQDVMESPRYVAFDEAENRLHAQKAVLLKLIRG